LKTVILAGGYGTRIRDVADDIPKPMIPIGPYPIIWHVMKIYEFYNQKDFILCLGYKGDVIKNFFLNLNSYTRDFTIDLSNSNDISFHNNSAYDWKVTLSDTGLNSMTGTRIKKIKKYIKDDTFLLTYGDGVSDINIEKLIDFHRSHGKILTVTGVHPPGRFGQIIANDNDLVTEFNEKPQSESGLISGGFFVANTSLFDYLDDSENLVFEEGPMRQLVKDKELMIYKHDGFWLPMDTSREYQMLDSIYKSGNIPWLK
jgi:glucose-1-phosphate cytidylyltransferase